MLNFIKKKGAMNFISVKLIEKVEFYLKKKKTIDNFSINIYLYKNYFKKILFEKKI